MEEAVILRVMDVEILPGISGFLQQVTPLPTHRIRQILQIQSKEFSWVYLPHLATGDYSCLLNVGTL